MSISHLCGFKNNFWAKLNDKLTPDQKQHCCSMHCILREKERDHFFVKQDQKGITGSLKSTTAEQTFRILRTSRIISFFPHLLWLKFFPTFYI